MMKRTIQIILGAALASIQINASVPMISIKKKIHFKSKLCYIFCVLYTCTYPLKMFRKSPDGKYVAKLRGLELRAEPDGAGGIAPVDGEADIYSADGVHIRAGIRRWMIDDGGGISFELEGAGRTDATPELVESLEKLGWTRGRIRLRSCPPKFFPFGANALVIGMSKCGKSTLAFDLSQKHGGPSLIMHGGVHEPLPSMASYAQVCEASPEMLNTSEWMVTIHDDVENIPNYLCDTMVLDSLDSMHHTNIITTQQPGCIPECVRDRLDLIVLFRIKDEGMRKIIYDQFFSCMPRITFEQAMETYTHNYGAIVLCKHLAANSHNWREFVFHIKAGTCASRAKTP